MIHSPQDGLIANVLARLLAVKFHGIRRFLRMQRRSQETIRHTDHHHHPAAAGHQLAVGLAHPGRKQKSLLIKLEIRQIYEKKEKSSSNTKSYRRQKKQSLTSAEFNFLVRGRRFWIALAGQDHAHGRFIGGKFHRHVG